MYYCSIECRVEDWNNCHKFEECKLYGYKAIGLEFDSYQDDINEGLRLAFRFALKRKFDLTIKDTDYVLFDGRKRKVDDLMSHCDNWCLRIPAVKAISMFLVQEGIFDHPTEFITRFGQIYSNTFEIDLDPFAYVNQNERKQELSLSTTIANALYVEASVFDHSCKPNAIRTFEGLKIVIRATAHIDTNHEHIFMSYGDNVLPRIQRQNFLKEQFLFECKCSRCSIEFESDDSVCTRFLELFQQSQLLVNEEDSFKAAMAAYFLSKQLFGDYSDYSLNCIITARTVRKCPGTLIHGTFDAEQVLLMYKELRNTVLVTRNCKLPYYSKCIEDADSFKLWYANPKDYIVN